MRTHWMLLVAAMVVVLTFGCSDDKKPQQPPGTEKKAEQPEKKTAPAPAPAPQEKKAEPAEEGPAGEKPASEEPAAVAPERVEPADGTVEAPKDTLPDMPAEPPKQIERALAKTALHGGMAPLDVLVEKVGSVLSPGLKAMMETAIYQGLLAEIAGEMKMTDMDWFDRTRSLRIAVRSQDSVVLLVPITSTEKFLAALPADLRPEGEATAPLRFKLGDSFAEVVGKDLLLSDAQENIDQLDGALKLELSKLQVEPIFSVFLEGASIHPLVSTALDEVERNMEQVAPMDPTQKEFFAKIFNLLKDIVAEIDRIEINLDIADNDMVLRYAVSTIAGTNLHAAVSGSSNAAIDTLKYMPAKSWFVGGQNIDPKLFMPWLERYMDILASMYSMSTDEKIELWKDYKVMVNLMTGDVAYAVYTDAGFPMSMSSVTEVADGAKMAELTYGMYDYFFQKAMDTLPPESRQMFAGRSLKELIAQVQPMIKSFGVNLMLDTEIYQGVQMDYLRISLDYTLMNLPPDVAWLKEIVKDKLDFVIAFAPKHLVFTLGPNALVRAKEIVDGTTQMNPADLFPGVDAAKYNFVMNFSPLSLMDSLDVIPEFQAWVREEAGKEIEMVAGHKGIFILGGANGGKAWMDVRVDIEKVMPLVEHAIKKEMEAPKATDEVTATEGVPTKVEEN